MPEFRVSGDLSRGTSLAIPVHGRVGLLRWSRTPTARRYLFGYTLLAPAVLYVGLLVGVPFLFSLYVALSDATVGDPVSRFVGLDNFKAALENSTSYCTLRNTIGCTVDTCSRNGMLTTPITF